MYMFVHLCLWAYFWYFVCWVCVWEAEVGGWRGLCEPLYVSLYVCTVEVAYSQSPGTFKSDSLYPEFVASVITIFFSGCFVTTDASSLSLSLSLSLTHTHTHTHTHTWARARAQTRTYVSAYIRGDDARSPRLLHTLIKIISTKFACRIRLWTNRSHRRTLQIKSNPIKSNTGEQSILYYSEDFRG